jgi:hypothetical protein
MGPLHEDLLTFMMTSCWILLRMRNVSDKRCTVNQNTHFMFKNLFPHYEGNVEKYGTAREFAGHNITRWRKDVPDN